ncbi:hypothetical protein M378DRAFT_171366 [Amanita muscaria Koide BX008]|uniref:Uncharacterized protein n=1 Tax=Amanita muscaria (strain Koide BX008) TaxID=946122 RepID=A0A0C2W996_AMAMK|nr:hypothetical protein M378DRAFT_171366 [Amanita muscaria Koide BX008]
MTGTATSSSLNKPKQEEAPTKSHSTCKGPYYPEFVSFSALIAQFRAELHSFLRDQAQLALRRRYTSIEDCESSTSASKPPATENVAPTPTSLGPLFTFKGQSSTVCSTPNIMSPSHRTAILSHLVYVRSELERASLLQLRPENTENPLVAFKEGFAVRFVCMHAIPLGWFLSGEQDNEKQRRERETETGAGDMRKDIKGELDIIVFPDHSHHILPGQTTMIKFRMGVVNFS